MGFFSDLKTKRALSDLTERLETVERQVKASRLEWEDTYDRLRRLMGRVAKRALRDEAKVGNGEDETEPQLELTSDTRGPTGGMLTPRQRQIQQEILRRRGGGG
jgi:hypothetical protein